MDLTITCPNEFPGIGDFVALRKNLRHPHEGAHSTILRLIESLGYAVSVHRIPSSLL